MSEQFNPCEEWAQKFTKDHSTVITPNDSLVVSMVKNMGIDMRIPKMERVETAWKHVINSIEYGESNGWKKPRRTIQKGIADCEDFTFLMASIFPNINVTESEIAVGRLSFPDGYEEFHTWNTIDGKIVDATGVPGNIDNLTYSKYTSWSVTV